MSKTGLVLEGGSLRGVFSAGVLDYLMEKKVTFPYIVGVSAGAGNAANFISCQRGRTKKVITHEGSDSYFGIGQMMAGGKMLDINKLVGYDKEPFDYETFSESETVSEYVALNAKTGKVEYLSPGDSIDRLLQVCKASCSIPLMTNPAKVGSGVYFDGSIVDSIPFKRALDRGCDRVVVVLTRYITDQPTDYTKMKLLLDVGLTAYPKVIDAMMRRTKAYDKQMKELVALEKAGKAFVIRPTKEPIAHFENDKTKINAFYKHGLSVMKKHFIELQDFMNN